MLDAHFAALNARDEAALAETLHFPHYRLSQGPVQIWETADQYFADFLARAGDGAELSWANAGVVARTMMSRARCVSWLVKNRIVLFPVGDV